MSTVTLGAGRAPTPLWLLGLIAFTATSAMHIFVPALPDAAVALNASPATMQLTVSAYIIGLAGGQLIYGPLSDRIGRRPMLLIGLGLFAVSALAAVFAPNVQTLIAARLMQAFGACAGLVIGRAMARDGLSMAAATKRLALLGLMVTLGPGLAPLIGATLIGAFGWQSIFIALCLLGVFNFGITWVMVPPPDRAHKAIHSGVMRGYTRLALTPRFLAFALGGGCATTAIYGFVAVAPFIFVHDLGRPVTDVGIYLAVNVVGLWLGSFTTSRLVERVPIRLLLVLGNGLSVLSAMALLLGILLGAFGLVLLVATMTVFAFGAGVSAPAAMSQALSVSSRSIGSASGLYGFIQMLVGAICTSLAGLGSDPAWSVAITLTVAGLVAQLCFWSGLRATPPTV